MIFITALNLSNINSRFSAITRLSGDELSACSDYILSAKCQVERLLEVTPSDEEQSLCEYAAACIANYSYVCALLSKPESYVTANGLYSSSKPDNALFAAAKSLKDNALSQIKHLLCDECFMFAGVC